MFTHYSRIHLSYNKTVKHFSVNVESLWIDFYIAAKYFSQVKIAGFLRNIPQYSNITQNTLQNYYICKYMKDKLHNIKNRALFIYTANLGLEPAMPSNKLQLMPYLKYNPPTNSFTPNKNPILTPLKSSYNA